MDDGRCNTTPVAHVSEKSKEWSAADDQNLPVTPLHAGVLVDGDQDSLTDLAFLDLDAVGLAVRSLAASLSGGGDFCIVLVEVQSDGEI